MAVTPKKQYETQASKILARRAKCKNNETGAEPTATPEPTETNEAPAPEKGQAFEGVDKKALRAICDERKLPYKKKDTVAQLIVILNGEGA